MRKLFILVFVALLVSVLGGGIRKTLYRDYGIVVFNPDSLISVRAHQIVWGNFWVIQSDSTDTMSMTPDKMTIDSITITDYLHCTDDVRFDSTLYFTDGGADTSSIVQDGTNLKFASDNPFAMSRQLTFVEDVDRTGEGTILFANAIPIGMTTPGDCQGMKTEFKYGVSPTLTGGGKVIQGLMLKMTMDQRWKFASANRNADVRAIGVQAELNDSLGGVLSAIYANAYTDIATDKQIIGEHTTGAYGVGMCAIEARTEIKGAGALTVPHIAGLYVLHRRMGSGGVTGDYHAIHIENSQGTGAISGTETAIHFEPNTMAPPGANFDYGIDMEPVAFGTADVRLSSGATVINPDDDTIKITEAIIELIGDALLDDVTIDSALTVEGKAVFNDTVMLGDSADKMILPKGSAIELYDTTDTDKFEIYDDGTHSVFASANPFTMDKSLWLLGDTLFFTDGGADTNYIVNNGTYLIFGGDVVFRMLKATYFVDDLIGVTDSKSILWNGWQWQIDNDNDDALAFISFHAEDSIKVDTTGATGHRLSWTGAGGMEIRDGTGADTARWYDDGTHTTFTTDNDFVLSDDVTLGDTINTVFLPKGTRLILADSSGADTTIFHNDGVKLSIISDNKIEFGGNNIYLYAGDTLFFAEGENDAYFTLHGANFELASNLAFLSMANFGFNGNIDGNTDACYFYWDGWKWAIDADNDDAVAMIIFHNEDSIKVDTSLHVMEWTGSGGIQSDVMVSVVCDTVASAATITLGNYNNFVITGTANMDSIDTAGAFPNWGIAYIQFTGIALANGLTDGKNLKLAGNFAHNADDMIILQRRGNIFYELSRSAN